MFRRPSTHRPCIIPPPPYYPESQLKTIDAPLVTTELRQNVIIFGESGAGKSSVVNMLLGKEHAPISNDAKGCTFKSTRFDLEATGRPIALWDTAGMNEGDVGTVPQTCAIVALYELLQKLSDSDGVSLLIFVYRGPRVKESAQQNWVLFNDVICQKKVPVLLVVTGMENEADREDGLGMDGWWKDNEETFGKYQIIPDAAACITATRGRQTKSGKYVNDDIYLESQEKVLRLIGARCAKQPLQLPPRQWFKTVFVRSWHLAFGFIPVPLKRKKELLRDVKEKLTTTCGMALEDAEELVRQLNIPIR